MNLKQLRRKMRDRSNILIAIIFVIVAVVASVAISLVAGHQLSTR